VVVVGAFVGDVAAGEAAVAELRRLAPEVDTWAPATATELSHLSMDPEQPIPFSGDAMLLRDIDAAGLRAFTVAVRPGTPLLLGELRHLGGALARVPEAAGALGALPGEFLLVGGGVVTGPEATVAVGAALRDLRSAMAGYDTGRAFANFADRPVDPATLYTADAYQRLRAIRAAIDPDGLMAPSYPVPPTSRDE
jgi:hypothetical protein